MWFINVDILVLPWPLRVSNLKKMFLKLIFFLNCLLLIRQCKLHGKVSMAHYGNNALPSTFYHETQAHGNEKHVIWSPRWLQDTYPTTEGTLLQYALVPLWRHVISCPSIFWTNSNYSATLRMRERCARRPNWCKNTTYDKSAGRTWRTKLF